MLIQTLMNNKFFLIILLFPVLIWAQPKQHALVLSESQRLEFDRLFFDGLKEKLLNNYAKAEDYYKQALKIDRSNANVWYQLSSVLLMQKKFNEAEEACNMAYTLQQNNLYYLIQLAGIYKMNGKYRDAAVLQEKIFKQTNNVNDLFDLAETYYLAKNYSQSIKTLDRAEKILGPRENIYLQRKQIYLSINQLGKAVAEMDKLIKLYPAELRYKGMKADLLMANGKTNQALQIYNDILKVDPNNGYAAFALADFYRSIRDTLNWYAKLKIGMASNVSVKEKVEVLMQIIPHNELPNHTEQCLHLIEIFEKTNPNEAAPLMLKGDLYMQKRDFSEARYNYRKALQFDASSLIIWEQILFCNNQLNDFEQMLDDCNEIISIYPEYLQAYLFKAYSSYRLKKYDETISACTNGLSIADNRELMIELMNLLGDAYHFSNKYQLSDSVFAEVLKLDPENTYTLNNWAYFLSLRNTQLDKADSMSALTLKLEPDNASYLDTYGWILYKKDKYDKALEYIEKSLKAYPDNPEVLEHMGDVLYKLNRIDEAIKHWEKAKQSGSESKELSEKIKNKKLP